VISNFWGFAYFISKNYIEIRDEVQFITLTSPFSFTPMKLREIYILSFCYSLLRESAL